MIENSHTFPIPSTDDAEDGMASMILDLREHKITMTVHAGDLIDGGKFHLQGGILIMGAIRANIVCKTGSAIILKGAEFQGELTAENVFVEGKITARSASAMSRVTARGASPDGILVLSSSANVQAYFSSRATQISNGAKLHTSQFLALQKPAVGGHVS